jgi:ubiquinone/menaquinone biosynthesis C-methylase UbiE
MEHYLSEIIRVLKRGGRCLITFFFANEESLMHIRAKKSTLLFNYDKGIYRTIKNRNPEDAICYDEYFIKSLYAKSGLKVVEPVHYGSWCGRKNFLSYQDIIVAIKQ